MDTVTYTARIGNTAYHLGEYGVCISGKSSKLKHKIKDWITSSLANTPYSVGVYAVLVYWEDRLDKRIK